MLKSHPFFSGFTNLPAPLWQGHHVNLRLNSRVETPTGWLLIGILTCTDFIFFGYSWGFPHWMAFGFRYESAKANAEHSRFVMIDDSLFVESWSKQD